MQKGLPIGVSDYRELKEEYFFVDKSGMIQDFLTLKNKVTLITRPRRFGKTLNMSMLAEFFDITKDSHALFSNTAIINSAAVSEMNQYPTIFLSFANCKGTRADIRLNIFNLLQIEMGKYYPLIKKLPEDDNLIIRYNKCYQEIMNNADFTQIQITIITMCELLYKVYRKPVMLLIDEYDTPFIEAHINGCYEELHSPMAGMLSSALKNNPYLKYAMLTGIQRIAKENIFSGLNNLSVFTVNDKEYAQYFGFTVEETKTILSSFDLEYSDAVKQMYDGYRIGNMDIYNPWSIVNYSQRRELIPYWVNTSANLMIREAMRLVGDDFRQAYEALIQNGYLETTLDLQTSFYEEAGTSNLWGLFVNAGYLTIQKQLGEIYTLRIPNQEVAKEFQRLTMEHIHQEHNVFTMMMSGLYDPNPERFLQNYRHFLLHSTSYHDLINENSVHSLFLGMCAYLSADYIVKSNREAGKGRYDITLQAKSNIHPSYVIEFKYIRKEDGQNNPDLLKTQCRQAIKQIQANHYDIDLTGNIIYIALAHCGKEVAMEWIKKASV